jgi:hypothetical protein
MLAYSKGQTTPKAHLGGLYSGFCKLLYHAPFGPYLLSRVRNPVAKPRPMGRPTATAGLRGYGKQQSVSTCRRRTSSLSIGGLDHGNTHKVDEDGR